MLSAVDAYRFHGFISQQECKADSYLFALKGVSWQSSEDFSVFGCYWSTHVQGPPKPAPVAESAPAAAPGRRFLQSETNKMLSSIYWIIFVCHSTDRVVCTSLAETQEYSKGLYKIGKDWKGVLAFYLAVAPGKFM